MFCGKCGSEIPADAVFCENCGAPVGEVSASAESIKQTVKRPKKKVILVLVSIIILVFVLGIAGFTYYDMKILPEEVVHEISVMKLEEYDKTIKSAMDEFFDTKYNWAVEEMGGRYFVMAEGIAYQTKYEFKFWYDRKPPNVDFDSVSADGKLLEKGTDEYYEFMDEVFCMKPQTSGRPDAEETDATESESDESGDLYEPLEVEQEDNGNENSEDVPAANQSDDERYWASDEFEPELHDFVTEDAEFEIELSLTYTRMFCGRFDFYVNYYDETGSVVKDHYTGVFDEDMSGNGILKFDTGEKFEYTVDYLTDPANLVLIDDAGDTIDLIELI